jgi:hypothetical protein
MDPTCSSSSTLTTPTKPSISALESTPPHAKETPEERPFPFLKLSAELRNEIYSLVLGGSKAIHMRRRSKANLEIEESKRWFSKVCTEPPSRYEPFWNLTGMGHLQYDDPAGIDKDMAWAWGPIWGPCCDEGCPPGNVATTPLQVQLLRVCRQIYKEAALVPFKENVFDSTGRLAPAWPFLTRAFGTLQCHAIANVVVGCCLVNLRRLPALLPGLKRLFCGLDAHVHCGCEDMTEFPDVSSKAVERTEEEAAAKGRAGWVATCAELEETCRIVRGMGLLAVRVKLDELSWYQRFRSLGRVMTVERERWLIAELEEAFVAEKSVGEDESVGNGMALLETTRGGG